MCEALDRGCHMHCLLSAPLGSSKQVLIPFPLYGWGAGAQGEVKWLAQGHKASENSWATISSSVLNTNDLVSQLSFWSMVHFILQLEGRRSGRLGALLKDAQLGSFRAASDCGFGTLSAVISCSLCTAWNVTLKPLKANEGNSVSSTSLLLRWDKIRHFTQFFLYTKVLSGMERWVTYFVSLTTFLYFHSDNVVFRQRCNF